VKQADVNATLTVFLVALAVPYSSEVQQPMRATAVLGGRPHMRLAGSVDREQGCASSLHPEARSSVPVTCPAVELSSAPGDR